MPITRCGPAPPGSVRDWARALLQSLPASATYGLYGIALGAGSGAFLLVQMLRGKPSTAGATFMLPAMLIPGLVAAGAMILAQLPWYSVLVLAVVPIAAWLPVPARARVWQQAILLSSLHFCYCEAFPLLSGLALVVERRGTFHTLRVRSYWRHVDKACNPCWSRPHYRCQ